MTGFGEGLCFVWIEGPLASQSATSPASASEELSWRLRTEAAGAVDPSAAKPQSAPPQRLLECWRVQADLRSVNARGLELSLRHPLGATGEKRLREVLAQRLGRGRVELRLELQKMGTADRLDAVEQDETASPAQGWARLRPELLRRIQELKAVQELAQSEDLQLQPVSGLDLLRFAQSEAPSAGELVPPALRREGQIGAAVQALQSAADALLGMRKREGEAIETQLRAELQSLADLHAVAAAQQPLALGALSQRWLEKSQELWAHLVEEARCSLGATTTTEATIKATGKTGGEALETATAWQNRLAQELVLLAGRSDVQEELVRIDAHIQQMRDVLQEPATAGQGKRLTFLCQELQREWNTFGNKNADHESALQIVDAKAALERIREQAQNVE